MSNTVGKAIVYGFGGCLGVGFAIVFVGGCLFTLGTAMEKKNLPTTSKQPAAPASTATLERFNRIQDNMNIHEVERIVGCPGIVESSSTFGAGTSFASSHAMYTWKDADGFGSMSVSITNGVVTSKSQFGLD